MKKEIAIVIVTVVLLFGGCLFIKNFLDNMRTPLKQDVILDYKTINVSNISVNDNQVVIIGELNILEKKYLEMYIISKVDLEKKKDTIYVNIYGGYGSDEEQKKFTIDEQFDGEEIKKVILKGSSKKSDYIVWTN